MSLQLLPYEVDYEIISNLNCKDLTSLCATSKHFRRICDDEDYWLYKIKSLIGEDVIKILSDDVSALMKYCLIRSFLNSKDQNKKQELLESVVENNLVKLATFFVENGAQITNRVIEKIKSDEMYITLASRYKTEKIEDSFVLEFPKFSYYFYPYASKEIKREIIMNALMLNNMQLFDEIFVKYKPKFNYSDAGYVLAKFFNNKYFDRLKKSYHHLENEETLNTFAIYVDIKNKNDVLRLFSLGVPENLILLNLLEKYIILEENEEMEKVEKLLDFTLEKSTAEETFETLREKWKASLLKEAVEELLTNYESVKANERLVRYLDKRQVSLFTIHNLIRFFTY